MRRNRPFPFSILLGLLVGLLGAVISSSCRGDENDKMFHYEYKGKKLTCIVPADEQSKKIIVKYGIRCEHNSYSTGMDAEDREGIARDKVKIHPMSKWGVFARSGYKKLTDAEFKSLVDEAAGVFSNLKDAKEQVGLNGIKKVLVRTGSMTTGGLVDGEFVEQIRLHNVIYDWWKLHIKNAKKVEKK